MGGLGMLALAGNAVRACVRLCSELHVLHRPAQEEVAATHWHWWDCTQGK